MSVISYSFRVRRASGCGCGRKPCHHRSKCQSPRMATSAAVAFPRCGRSGHRRTQARQSARDRNFLQQHHGAVLLLFESLGSLADVALDDIVAQHHADLLALDERFGQAQRVGNTAFAFLISKLSCCRPNSFPFCSSRRKSPAFWPPVTISMSRTPASTSICMRVEDHRLVVDRKQVLVGYPCQWIEPRAGSSGQNDAFHASPSDAALED